MAFCKMNQLLDQAETYLLMKSLVADDHSRRILHDLADEKLSRAGELEHDSEKWKPDRRLYG